MRRRAAASSATASLKRGPAQATATRTSCCGASWDRPSPVTVVVAYAKITAPLTALGSPTARFTWMAETQAAASFDAMNPRRRASAPRRLEAPRA